LGIHPPARGRGCRIGGVGHGAKCAWPTRRARPMFFVPLAQTVKYSERLMQMVGGQSPRLGSALLRTRLKPGELEPLLRKTFAAVDANLTVNTVRTMQDQIARVFDQQRAVAGLAGLF